MAGPRVIPPDPPLTDEEVVLRRFRRDDAEAVVAACTSSDIARHTGVPADLTVEGARDLIEQGIHDWNHGVARFAITTRRDDGAVGQIGVDFQWAHNRAEVFYWLGVGARGRGLASRSSRLVTRWALGFRDIARVQLATEVDNVASQKVAERSGFVREGILRAWAPVNDRQPDVIMWSRLPDDRQGREADLG